jgi:F0F1-type ATP synthase membrane subunit a
MGGLALGMNSLALLGFDSDFLVLLVHLFMFMFIRNWSSMLVLPQLPDPYKESALLMS